MAALPEILRDELDALRSIFPVEELRCEISNDALSVIVRVSGPCGGAVIHVDVGRYPSSVPVIAFEGLRRSDARDARTKADAEGATLLGEPMLFQLVTLARDAVGGTAEPTAEPAADFEMIDSSTANLDVPPPPPYPLAHGALITEKKSTFQAHVTSVKSLSDVYAALNALQSVPRISRATHNMFAYRFSLPSGGVVADNEDDGEDAAGGKLAELLANVGAANVLIIVSRWFGGVLLGPSRFGIINNCARGLLVECGFDKRKLT